MLAKPEKKIELYYFKCKIAKCEKPFGHLYTSKSDVERQWMHHAFQFHVGDIKKIPPFVIKHRNFKRIKE